MTIALDLARQLREAASRGYFYNHSTLVMEAAAELKRKDAQIAKLQRWIDMAVHAYRHGDEDACMIVCKAIADEQKGNDE
jgi:hypothetical protein